MRRFHIALGVKSLSDSIADYTQRLGVQPEVIVPGHYALWRTAEVNFSIRQLAKGEAPGLRHLGWEDGEAPVFTETRDCNGFLWEMFTEAQQRGEIRAYWPDAGFRDGGS